MESSRKCRCGQDLHYSDPDIYTAVQRLVDLLGEDVKITVEDREYMVSRHFLALHGIKASELEDLAAQGIVAKVI